MSEHKKGVNLYLAVFVALAIIVVLAALSIPLFNQNTSATNVSLANLQNLGAAPNIQGISAWINSPPLSMSQLRGRVVLVDFWTYSCINCIRTIPFLNALQSEYGNDGLVIIGVSAPEFQFEHNYTNVLAAVRQFGIKYPVALDNNFSTWDAYNNQYWPADYLIDKNGNIRYESFGEGPSSFNQTQQVVRELLENASYKLPSNATNVVDALNFSQEISPEMYLGYQELATGRTNYFGDPVTPAQEANKGYYYTIPNISQPNPDTIYLGGEWYGAQDSIIAENGSVLFLAYRAKNVNVVASGNGANTSITVKLDGQNLAPDYLGSDDHLVNGTAVVNVSTSRLYNIVSAPEFRHKYSVSLPC
jgi:thiol-disulfide isomerase/thioredoxin